MCCKQSGPGWRGTAARALGSSKDEWKPSICQEVTLLLLALQLQLCGEDHALGHCWLKLPENNFVKLPAAFCIFLHPVIAIVQSLLPLHFRTDLDALFAHEIGYFPVISRSYILGQSPVVTSGGCLPLRGDWHVYDDICFWSHGDYVSFGFL